MKKLFTFIFIFFLFFLGIFYFSSFFISKTIEIALQPQKSDQNVSPPVKEKNPSLPIKEETFYLKDFGEIRKKLLFEKKNFLEANLAEMKIKIYKEGSLVKELPIFRRGNLQKWGGTPLGFYQILSKNKLAYAALANSYMPWSLHIYGKYYIHGDNWYPDRGVDTFPFTGGCIRLSDKNAKVLYDLTEVGTPILVTDRGLENDNFRYIRKNLTQFPKLSAKSYLVADLDSGFVFTAKDYQKKLPIASLTKLMTALVVAEIVDLRKSIVITPEMLEPLGNTKGLVAGKSFRVFELFYPLLIESSNDAAEALGYFLGKEKTIKLMNEKAKAILMEDTEFVDLTGLDPQNTSTVQDLFYLARYILNVRPLFLEISKGKEVWMLNFPLSPSFKNLKNKNIFFEHPNFLGGKIGFIEASQFTGLFLFRFPLEDGSERKIVIVLLGSDTIHGFPGDLEKDAQKILDWLKENYF